MNKSVKLDRKLIFEALDAAASYEEGLAEAYSNEGPHAKVSLRRAKSYRALRVKLGLELGFDSRNRIEAKIEDELSNGGKMVTIQELRKMRQSK